MSKDISFKVGDGVVYPSHGVGEIINEETSVIAGTRIAVYVIEFTKEKMVLRIPKSRAEKTGLRHLSSEDEISIAIETLKNNVEAPRGVWNKRAQGYLDKINSGNLIAVAEVVRDLHCNVVTLERSYSERSVYNTALERLVQEYAKSCGYTVELANQKIKEILDFFSA